MRTPARLLMRRRRHDPWRAMVGVAASLALVAACGTSGTEPSRPRDRSAAVIHTRDGDGLNGTLVDDPPLRIAPVRLRDTNGESVDLANMAVDQATIVFFGYTHCPDVCPTTMADLAAARRLLSPTDAKRVHIRFITVDPARDTPDVLKRWLAQFKTSAIGLRGPRSKVNAAEQSLYADTSSVRARSDADDPSADAPSHAHTPGDDAETGSSPQVSHSGSVYIFAPQEKTVLYTGGTTASQYAADLRLLLRQ